MVIVRVRSSVEWLISAMQDEHIREIHSSSLSLKLTLQYYVLHIYEDGRFHVKYPFSNEQKIF